MVGHQALQIWIPNMSTIIMDFADRKGVLETGSHGWDEEGQNTHATPLCQGCQILENCSLYTLECRAQGLGLEVWSPVGTTPPQLLRIWSLGLIWTMAISATGMLLCLSCSESLSPGKWWPLGLKAKKGILPPSHRHRLCDFCVSWATDAWIRGQIVSKTGLP